MDTGNPVKKTGQKEISYLKTDGVELLVSQIDRDRSNGLRDYVIILLPEDAAWDTNANLKEWLKSFNKR